MSTEALYPEDTIIRVELTEQELDASGDWSTLAPAPRTDGTVRYATSADGPTIGALSQDLEVVPGTRVYQASFEGSVIAAAMTAANIAHNGRLVRITRFGEDSAPVVTPVVFKAYRG